MDCHHRIEVPLRAGKKMKKRRELDALIASQSSSSKRANRRVPGATNSQDKLLSVSTDDPEDYAWTNVAGSSRRSHRKIAYFRMCGPLLLGIIGILIVAILYWLYFDLRQQLTDYRQKIEDVSAMSKNFPDTLQRWHETSSFLLKNQTAVISEINELQKTMESLRNNFSNLEAAVAAQRNHGKDEKLVADFGAKIEAVATDIEAIKEHYNKYTEVQKTLQADTEALKLNLSQLPTLQANALPANLSEDIAALNKTTLDSFKLLANDLKDVNNTLSQTTKMLAEEVSLHKTKIDDLLDRSENITSHVATISNSWPEYKQKVTSFDESLDKIEKEITLANSKNSLLASSMDQLKNFCIQSMGNKKPPISEDSSSVTKPLQPEANAAKPEFVKPSANATEQIQESMKLH
ncbi:EF-hand calcium-binding domain-containing protein 14 isoform X1 [Drosophila suzukii]|uniref:EF-hand calcium-binding domain-containing protein 14 isoform X1 n=2 Tax=Drosophila suzukii TaxID=28584 RepID=A0AB39Z5E1_DROSZ